MPPAAEFDAATAVRRTAAGRYAATALPDWWATIGPNGGYLAAIVLRALLAELADPARPVRSLSLHFLRAPAPGDVELTVTVERAGRGLTTLSARLDQGERACLLAVGAFAGAYPSAADWDDAPAPALAAAADTPPAPLSELAPPVVGRLDLRPAIGPPPLSSGDVARTGGWMRLRDGRTLDAPLLAFFADAWWPAPFTRLDAPSPAPTIDLTLHFRAPPAAEEAFVLAEFGSLVSAGGYFEEDGRLWGTDGRLLLQSRQLALLLPGTPPAPGA